MPSQDTGCIWPMSMLLNPAVRVMTDWKNPARTGPAVGVPQCGRVGPFDGGDEHGPAHQQDGRAGQDQLGVHAPVTGVRYCRPEFEEHRETQAADDHGARDREADPGIADEPHEVVGIKREAGVVEGGHRMEDSVPERAPRRIAVSGMKRSISTTARTASVARLT